MGKGHRHERLGEEIKKIISTMLLRELKDPRLHENMVSISAVEVTNDSSYATVYISLLGTGKDGFATDEQKNDVLEAFRRAKGLIKKEIGKKVKVRHIPELIFKMDNSLEYGMHMSKVIDSLGIENYKSDVDNETETETSTELDDIMKDL